MDKKKPTLKERLQYRLDERMSRGTISLIKFLLAGTVSVVLIVSIIITATHVSEADSFGLVFWDNLAYAFNAWIPFTADSDRYGFLIPTAVVSFIGILFTSVLIGIISSAIEERISQLRKGNSVVLENGHTVILGFKPGEYTLIEEIIESAAGRKMIIVVAGDCDKDEMEDLIHANISVPKNIRIICRTVDICDPGALGCCSIPECRNVIINPTDDETTVKAVLAAMLRLGEDRKDDIRIVASVESDGSVLPRHMRRHNNIIMLQTRDIIARIIARSCSQPGISSIFDEIFAFRGSEFYVDSFDRLTGLSFGQVMGMTEGAVPAGMIKDSHTYLRPDENMVFETGDKLIYFAASRGAIIFHDTPVNTGFEAEVSGMPDISERIVIFGYNETFDTLIRELPDSIEEIVLADGGYEEDFECEGRKITVFRGDIEDDEAVRRLVSDKDHLVLLNSHVQDEDTDSDYINILRLIKLRDYKGHYGYHYTITTEMISESSRRLVKSSDPTDYVVASNIASMVIAQVAENPELEGLIKEILSDGGSEIYMKPRSQFGLPRGRYTMRELRMILYSAGCILLGTGADLSHISLDPDTAETEVKDDTLLVVMGEG